MVEGGSNPLECMLTTVSKICAGVGSVKMRLAYPLLACNAMGSATYVDTQVRFSLTAPMLEWCHAVTAADEPSVHGHH
jgi:hypothetical protein